MDDLGGADKQEVGDISAMSFAGFGDNQEVSYQPLATILLIRFPWLGLILVYLAIPTSAKVPP